MSQNRSISDPNRVQKGSNRVLYQFRLIRNHFQPKRTNGNPKQPIFHFLGGRFWVDFGSISDISDGPGRLFGKWSENGSDIFSGPNFRAEESSRLTGSKCQTEPRRPFLGPTFFGDQKVLPLSAKSQHFY